MSKRNFKELQPKGGTSPIEAVQEAVELPAKKLSEDKPERKEKDKKEFVQPPVPNKVNQCHFYLKRKKRYCSLTAGSNSKYCGEHSHLNVIDENSAESNVKVRVPCPFDPNHTVFLTQLEKHKLKCNSKPLDIQPDYYKENINVLVKQDNSENTVNNKLNNLDKLQVLNLVDKVSKGFTNLNLSLDGEVTRFDHRVMNDQLFKKLKVKHVVQQASLIGHLENLGLLTSDYNFAEFGAGKGELSLYVKEAIEQNNHGSSSSKLSFYLVDRKNFRLKHDRLIKEAKTKETEVSVHRIKLDIKDLNLSQVAEINEKPLVVYSKHLCGAATDLTLTCINDFINSGGKVAGIVIALCCHHACSLNTFANSQYLNKLEFDDLKADFQPFVSLSSWATCGTREKVSSNGDAEQIDVNESDEIDDINEQLAIDTNHTSGLNKEARELVGFKVKRIIDSARSDYLTQFGFQANLIKYVDSKDSLENVALIATPLPTSTA